MEKIYFQLNSLTVLTGVSLAIIQYLFTNHQNTLKEILSNLKKIEFKKNNSVDNDLEVRWEKTILDCKARNYIINPNKLIGIGFLIILFITMLFAFILFDTNIPYFNANTILKIFAIGFSIFLAVGSILIYQIFSKEFSIKQEFKDIESQHNMVKRVLDSDKV